MLRTKLRAPPCSSLCWLPNTRVRRSAYRTNACVSEVQRAREAGATHPERLGEQLALLIDGASARTRVLNRDSFPTAAAIAAILIDNAIPTPSARQPSDDRELPGLLPFRWEANDGPITPRRPETDVEFGAAGAVAPGLGQEFFVS